MSRTVQIDYASDDIVQGYEKAIRTAPNLDVLLERVKFYSPLTKDAIQKVQSMDQADFKKFKSEVKKMSTEDEAEAERLVDEWGDLVMPRTMLEICLLATQYNVPFGLAFNRMQESGSL